MTNEITKTETPAQNALVIYDRIADPLAFIKEMGESICRSTMFGCTTVAQGSVIAWNCVCERKSPFDLLRTYYIASDGKLIKRTDAIYAEFRKQGGKVRWLESNDQVARAEFVFEGETITREYTIEQARNAKVKSTAWQTATEDMLRAALLRKTILMICPEVRTETYDFSDVDPGYETKAPVAQDLLKQVTPVSAPEPVVDAEEVLEPVLPPPLPETGDPLEAFLLPCEEKANAYLTNVLKWIAPGQTWRDLSDAHKGRIKAAPEAFLARVHAEAANGK